MSRNAGDRLGRPLSGWQHRLGTAWPESRLPRLARFRHSHAVPHSDPRWRTQPGAAGACRGWLRRHGGGRSAKRGRSAAFAFRTADAVRRVLNKPTCSTGSRTSHSMPSMTRPVFARSRRVCGLATLGACTVGYARTDRCSSCLCRATGRMGRRSIAISTQCAGCSLRLHGTGASPCLSGSSTRPAWPSSRLCFDGSETAAVAGRFHWRVLLDGGFTFA